MGCRSNKRLGQMILSGAIALIFAVIVPQAEAYQFYSVDTNDVGGCGQCHGIFRSGTYTSQAEGVSWGTHLHNVHLNNTAVGGNCGNCHFGAGTAGRTVNLSSSEAAADGVNAISCSGCHGRAEDTVGNPNANGAGWGAGLRQHHVNAGAPPDSNGQICTDCHADADTANFTVAGEDVMPPWFGTFGLAPCDDNLVGLAIGLDNDGDQLYDSADPDCQAPVCGDGTVTPGVEDCDPANPSPAGCCDPNCQFEPNNAACDNANVCDGPDECDGAGNCNIVGPPLDCDDGEVCTNDNCDPVTGCFTTNNTLPCDDLDAL
jgi:hypothetical protein